MKSETLHGYLFAIGAMVAYGVNALVIREGTQRFGVVLPGLVVALLTGLLLLLPLTLRGPVPVHRLPRASVLWILGSGLASSVGIGSYFVALSQTPVNVVTPVSSVYPLVTLILVRLFLHQSERITRRTILGVGSVVLGVVLIAVSRA